jgi:hypothetical protein
MVRCVVAMTTRGQHPRDKSTQTGPGAGGGSGRPASRGRSAAWELPPDDPGRGDRGPRRESGGCRRRPSGGPLGVPYPRMEAVPPNASPPARNAHGASCGPTRAATEPGGPGAPGTASADPPEGGGGDQAIPPLLGNSDCLNCRGHLKLCRATVYDETERSFKATLGKWHCRHCLAPQAFVAARLTATRVAKNGVPGNFRKTLPEIAYFCLCRLVPRHGCALALAPARGYLAGLRNGASPRHGDPLESAAPDARAKPTTRAHRALGSARK